jgi:hypothetical protein
MTIESETWYLWQWRHPNGGWHCLQPWFDTEEAARYYGPVGGFLPEETYRFVQRETITRTLI